MFQALSAFMIESVTLARNPPLCAFLNFLHQTLLNTKTKTE